MVSHHRGGDLDPALVHLSLPHVYVGRPLIDAGPGDMSARTDRLAGGAPREPQVFPAELVVRASS